MPRIHNYSAPIDRLHGDEKGPAAYETAGRRLSGIYNQQAQNVIRGGQLAAEDLLAGGKLAATIANLRAPTGTGGRGGGGGGGFNLHGGGSGGRGKGGGSGGDPLGEISDGAAAMGKKLAADLDPLRYDYNDPNNPYVHRPGELDPTYFRGGQPYEIPLDEPFAPPSEDTGPGYIQRFIDWVGSSYGDSPGPSTDMQPGPSYGQTGDYGTPAASADIPPPE